MLEIISVKFQQLLQRIKRPNNKSANSDQLRRSLLDIAVEEYRMREVLLNIMEKLNVSDISRFESKCRYFSKEVEKALRKSGFRLIDTDEFIGKPFDIGMAVKPININSFDEYDELIIDQMIEPIIMEGEMIARVGTVKLRRK